MSPVSIVPDHARERQAKPRDTGLAAIRRRDALKLIASGLAMTLAGCSRPQEEALPYIDMPEGLTAGEPQFYATALPLSGWGRGVIVEAVDGRPIKIAGNPRHPASLGSTDIFAEAEILSLYDPDRSRAVRGKEPVTTWNAFSAALRDRMAVLDGRQGAGLHVVTGRVASPTLANQLAGLMKGLPQAKLYSYEPAEGDLATMPAAAAQSLEGAEIIVCLDADPLGPGPRQIVNARAFAAGRKPGKGKVSRLYVAESTRTLTGANADHRIALSPRRIEALAAAITGGDSANLPAEAQRFARAVGDDIRAGGKVVLLAGDTLSAATRWRLAQSNGGGVAYAQTPAGLTLSPLDGLWEALEAGDVSDFVALDCNPCNDFPDPALSQAIEKAEFSFHAGTHRNETSGHCRWHAPLSHMLESWSDLAAFDGTVSIVQPLIRPLYDTRSVHEVVALMAGEAAPSDHEIVRGFWRQGRPGDAFETWWRDALVRGTVEGGAPTLATEDVAATAAQEAPQADDRPGKFVAVIRPDPSIHDGRHANNAWLQECPKPVGKHTWGNIVALSPADAGRLGVGEGDVVRVKSPDGEIVGSAHVENGHADGVIGLTLGYGRSAAGAIGNGLGYNARRLSPRRITALVEGVEVTASGDNEPVPTTQDHFRLEGELARLLPQVSQASDFKLLASKKSKKPKESFLNPDEESDGYRWAMVIDSAACIGCNACVIACQSENNIPVVGPEEVANSRIMHWLRIDRYELGEGEDAFTGFEPVPCMQCEKAPCEPVCPVEASVHDTEGLNDQVYNRCVGTRFCQSNCPYKVRRFNWFAYASGQEYKNLGADPLPAQKNPEVTVRARGVMEKCTYCVQRIARARHKAIASDQPIGEGEVVTACQQACPTQAISFGNLADRNSAVSRLREDDRHFTLLEELDTQPRTTYLARIRNAKAGYGKGAA